MFCRCAAHFSRDSHYLKHVFSPDLEGQSTAPVGSTDERQNGPDTGIARVEAAPCHRAQKQGNDFRRRPNSPMRTWAQMAPPKKPVTRIAPRTAVAGMA